MPSEPDPRPQRRVRNTELLRSLHAQWRGSCALDEMGDCETNHYSLHHILNKPRDDIQANLAMLCGDGTTGHHGRIEARERETCQHFAVYLITERLDTMAYLGQRLGGLAAVTEWFRTRLYYPV